MANVFRSGAWLRFGRETGGFSIYEVAEEHHLGGKVESRNRGPYEVLICVSRKHLRLLYSDLCKYYACLVMKNQVEREFDVSGKNKGIGALWVRHGRVHLHTSSILPISSLSVVSSSCISQPPHAWFLLWGVWHGRRAVSHLNASKDGK